MVSILSYEQNSMQWELEINYALCLCFWGAVVQNLLLSFFSLCFALFSLFDFPIPFLENIKKVGMLPLLLLWAFPTTFSAKVDLLTSLLFVQCIDTLKRKILTSSYITAAQICIFLILFWGLSLCRNINWNAWAPSLNTLKKLIG